MHRRKNGTTRVVVIGNANSAIENISAAQLYPFFANRKSLSHEFGLTLDHIQAYKFFDIATACRKTDADIFFIRPDWREDPSIALAAMEQIRSQHKKAIIIFLDPWDQTSSRYFGVIPFVDSFLKYQRLRDTSLYRTDFVGGSYLTDYLSRIHGYDLEGWHVGSPLPDGGQEKIDTYWNFALGGHIGRKFLRPTLLERMFPRLFTSARNTRQKKIDIFCRLSFGAGPDFEWYGRYRLEGVKHLEALQNRFRLAVDFSPEESRRVRRQQYREEIRLAKIAFSPFGWGEVTWRDYEAVANGCLLIKPSVAHLDTQPWIFEAEKTYVPIQWDFSDLAEKCTYYLENWDEAEFIIENAKQAFRSFASHKPVFHVVNNAMALATGDYDRAHRYASHTREAA